MIQIKREFHCRFCARLHLLGTCTSWEKNRAKPWEMEWRYGPLPNAFDRVSLAAPKHMRMKGKGMLSPVQNSGTLSVSTIGGDLTITGNVTSKGEIQLDGHVQGDVHCVAVVLGESANIEGNVAADDVVIRGRLIGSVRALRVTLQSMAHVEGDIIHQSLAMEQGAYFEGKSRRSEDLLSVSQSAAEDLAAIKPQELVDGSEKRKKKPEATFVRSIPEPD